MRLEDQHGRRLGRYEIVALLGRGGMAAVYRAHDTALRRDVALKVLYPQYSGDSNLIDRFQREAVLAASLDHPNIVPIYDVGEADGMVYIAMKLLGGQALADVLRQRPVLPLDEVVPIVEQIAVALDYAHVRQIVHRDIKAGNILLEDDPLGLHPGPRAILTDFGIAKSLGTSGLTGTGVLIGTPDYMAPEQIRSSQTVDYRADIYALGVLIFRCLTGRLPFEGGTEQVLMGHLYGDFSDPSMIVTTLPVAVDAVVRKAMARDPVQRYENAQALARALRAAASLETLTPPPARRRDMEGRAVIPRAAADNLGRGQPRPDEPTRRGDAAPPRRSGPDAPTRRNDARPPLERDTRPSEPRRRSAGPIVATILLILLIGGGIVLGQALLGRDGGGIAGGVPTSTPAATLAPPTEPPVATEPGIAVPPTDPPAPTAEPTTAPTAPAESATSTTAPVVPTNTTQPTNTPPPTPTNTPSPTLTPSPTPCPIALASGFGKLWNENQAVSEQLGCPTEPEQGSDIAEQPFEKGSMFWYGPPLNPIFVLGGIDRGSWLRFEDEALRAIPTPTPDPAPPCTAPLVSGFGLVWGSFPEVRTALGCPTAGEDGPFDGAYQPFARGTMLFSPEGLGRGKTIYVLYHDGTFERYDDTNP